MLTNIPEEGKTTPMETLKGVERYLRGALRILHTTHFDHPDSDNIEQDIKATLNTVQITIRKIEVEFEESSDE